MWQTSHPAVRTPQIPCGLSLCPALRCRQGVTAVCLQLCPSLCSLFLPGTQRTREIDVRQSHSSGGTRAICSRESVVMEGQFLLGHSWDRDCWCWLPAASRDVSAVIGLSFSVPFWRKEGPGMDGAPLCETGMALHWNSFPRKFASWAEEHGTCM